MTLTLPSVALDYALERGGGYDDRVRMDTLREFRPMLEAVEAQGWKPPEGNDNRFRAPIWAKLPGAGAAHPNWLTFMAWPWPTVRHWINVLIGTAVV